VSSRAAFNDRPFANAQPADLLTVANMHLLSCGAHPQQIRPLLPVA